MGKGRVLTSATDLTFFQNNSAGRRAVHGAPEYPLTGSCSSPEFDFLIACCAELPEEDRGSRLEGLADKIDPDQILSLAQRHHVIPQVYKQLSGIRSLAHPDLLARTSLAFAAHVRRNLLLTAELLRILAHFRARGITALAYKGPALAVALYHDVTQRQFGDLDLLIFPDDVRKARNALAELGYQAKLTLTVEQEQAHVAAGYEMGFRSDRGANLVEVKWRIVPLFFTADFNLDGLFARAIHIELGGQQVLSLGLEDLLLILCVHAAKHSWSQLSLLYDLAQLAKKPEIKWNLVSQDAERLGIHRIVAVSFLLAQTLHHSPLPQAIKEEAGNDRKAVRLAHVVARRICTGRQYETESLEYFRLLLQLRERQRDRWLFLWRLTSTPSLGEWSAIKLPVALFGFYRVVRIFRLLMRFLRLGLGLLARDASR